MLLSVLDLSFVTTGTPPSAALRNTLDLARHADRLGYARYWVAEHHNLPSVASPAPEIMIGQIAAVTERIRVGSGGVMLPNHAPLLVAERFKMLEAFYPGRIDLGLGRAPGTDQVTAFALRQRDVGQGRDDFLERLQELIFWDRGGFPENHPFSRVEAMPSDTPLPPIWILGSSDYGARLAASMGVGYAFAHHFASFDAETAMRLYREGFNPEGMRSARMRSSASLRSAPRPTRRPSGLPRASISSGCAASRANTVRCRARRRCWLTPTARPSASASAATAPASSSAARRP